MTESIASRVLMIRPASFDYNEETAESNVFQVRPEEGSDIQAMAVKEFDQLVSTLREEGIMVTVIDDDPSPHTPDAVFPNNWITLHSDGALITYPMQSEVRRQERREDIIEQIMEANGYTRRYSFEQYEEKGLYLEGTGSMVLDRQNRIVYACLSPRTDPTLLDKFCTLLGYRRCVFTATDAHGVPVYHTNVMMALGHTFAVICLESIDNESERTEVQALLSSTGKTIVPISRAQMLQFAGNMLLLQNRDGQPCLVMSSQARASLDPGQVDVLSSHAVLVNSAIPTIESVGGGSVRCMITELIDIRMG
ncbi:MAG: amidinotransferase [Saprospiraceae bacterium]|nr:amidinotransferase [Saprospiraceae bacterium]